MAEFQRESGVRRVTLESLAAADAFRSLGLDRRQALWHVQALPDAETLPLFAWGEASDTGPDPDVALPPMQLSEHVVADYQTLRLSLKAHPLSFLRTRFAGEASGRIVEAAALRRMRDGARVSVAGVVLVRQRPGSAKGVVFMTIEDETGVANAVVWAKTLERYRRVVMGARLIVIHGRLQRQQDIIHIVSERLEDRSDWLGLLAEGADQLKVPVANADEVVRMVPDFHGREASRDSHREVDLASSRKDGKEPSRQAPPHPERSPKVRIPPQRPRPLHPRAERIIPKSRDFH